ncbi:MAG: hypothetical protein E6022_05110 [Veillonella sp.]|jgi:hypothetical protein|nr:hypothetical protein [Veillonella sp.]
MGTIIMGNALHYKASDITGKLLDKELVKVYAKGTVKDVAKGTVSEVGGLASDGVLLVGTRLENEERFKGREDLIEKANSMDTRLAAISATGGATAAVLGATTVGTGAAVVGAATLITSIVYGINIEYEKIDMDNEYKRENNGQN